MKLWTPEELVARVQALAESLIANSPESLTRNQAVAGCAKSRMAGCGDRGGPGSQCGIARDCGFSRRSVGVS